MEEDEEKNKILRRNEADKRNKPVSIRFFFFSAISSFHFDDINS